MNLYIGQYGVSYFDFSAFGRGKVDFKIEISGGVEDGAAVDMMRDFVFCSAAFDKFAVEVVINDNWSCNFAEIAEFQSGFNCTSDISAVVENDILHTAFDKFIFFDFTFNVLCIGEFYTPFSIDGGAA